MRTVVERFIMLLTFAFAVGLAGPPAAQGARIKDLVEIAGVRGNPLVGYGIVVGLSGTGDDARSPITRRALANLMTHLGLQFDEEQINAKNVAAVLITTQLPPFARRGGRVDVTVSSVGTAKSLVGGTLVATPLKGHDAKTYALAQGSLSLGAFEAGGGSGSSQRKNHPTVARIPGGGIIERQAPSKMPEGRVTLIVRDPDFTTADRIARAIDAYIDAPVARVQDPGTVSIRVPERYRGKVAGLIARVESLEVSPDVKARVIVDERTGTIVVGSHVSLGKAAIAHGGIHVSIREQPLVSQPGAPGVLAPGETVVVPQSDVDVVEEPGQLTGIGPAADVADLAAALNGLGVKPRDLVAILRALSASGALQAELEVI